MQTTKQTFLRRAAAAGLLAAACAANSAWAAHEQTAINETRPLAADGKLSVNNMAGTITVKGWDRNEVAISGWLGEDVEKLDISGDARSLSVVVRYPNRMHGHIDESQLELRVPARAQLQLDAVSADIQVASVSGPIGAKSVSGDVELDVGSGEINAGTVSGDLTVKAPAFRTTLNSVSGDLSASGVRGVLKAETVSGQLSVDGGSFSDIALQSVSGDLELRLALEASGKLSAETLSGDIELHLPKAPDAELTMKTFSGELQNAFAAAHGDEDEDVRRVSTTLGSGRGRIDLHTFSGDISIDAGRH